eukprot:TRINITY_DN1059_c0_g1_i3.p1 TRINITY_DN1059_c0_g1~~TRINITY_DN1059_c0_g1_i3.p1  ORF type:complete len:649 (+),score=262.20 TRINITY_DN1059_c0_g1_i3:109-2055(+)
MPNLRDTIRSSVQWMFKLIVVVPKFCTWVDVVLLSKNAARTTLGLLSALLGLVLLYSLATTQHQQVPATHHASYWQHGLPAEIESRLDALLDQRLQRHADNVAETLAAGDAAHRAYVDQRFTERLAQPTGSSQPVDEASLEALVRRLLAAQQQDAPTKDTADQQQQQLVHALERQLGNETQARRTEIDALRTQLGAQYTELVDSMRTALADQVAAAAALKQQKAPASSDELRQQQQQEQEQDRQQKQVGDMRRQLDELLKAAAGFGTVDRQLAELTADVRRVQSAAEAAVGSLARNLTAVAAASERLPERLTAKLDDARRQTQAVAASNQALAELVKQLEAWRAQVDGSGGLATQAALTALSDSLSDAIASRERNLGETVEQYVRTHSSQLLPLLLAQQRAGAGSECAAAGQAAAAAAPHDGDQHRLMQFEQGVDGRLFNATVADLTGLPDYALASAGAGILTRRTSPPYIPPRPSAGVLSGLFVPRPLPATLPDVILSADNSVGNCWAVPHDGGTVTVRLAEPVYVTAVSLDHVPRAIAHDISSAPKRFQLNALRSPEDAEPFSLGTFEYSIDAAWPVQTFAVRRPEWRVDSVELVIRSNHGHPAYTCVYRLRVHGSPNNNTLSLCWAMHLGSFAVLLQGKRLGVLY